MENRRLIINAIASAFQTIVIGLVYFLLYRFVLKVLGADMLGLWSLIVASTSVGNIANLGMTASIVKFISAAQANNNPSKSANIIYTTLLTVGTLMLAVCIVLFFVFYFNLRLVVPAHFLEQGKMILPYALCSLLLNSISAIFLSALDGMELIYIRALIYGITSLLFFILCYKFVTWYGLMGLVYAQLIQGGVVLVLGWIFVKLKLSIFSIWRIRFSRSVFKEIFNYSVNFQIISLTNLLFDPITKFCLSLFGGLAMVGYFEMANRLITQLRNLIVSANQAVVPFITRKSETGTTDMSVYYTKMYKIMTLNSVLFFAALIIYAPLISKLWIGNVENVFVGAVFFLSVGWVVSNISAPAYFINMGTGDLKWNVISHVWLGVINLVLGFLMGKFLGGFYVIVATFLALVISSWQLISKFQQSNGIRSGTLLNKPEWFFVSILGVLVLSSAGYYLAEGMRGTIVFYSIITACLLAVFVIGVRRVRSLEDLYLALPRILLRQR